MSNVVISIDNLSKAYRLGQIGTGTLSDDLKLWWAKKRGKPNPLLKLGEKDDNNRDGETIWAIRDVTVNVEQGDVLGIIGRNGAGKSTLLKILSRVTAPTTGHVRVMGRIASLLEVGTGFHPDLTGRENIFLNGAILGMTKVEVQRKFDEIVAFSEIEKFIDTPVKRYSSGMYVRLAFAVAAHLEPEILIVDEVLAVGDVDFQKKCLGKMGDVAGEGRTVLFVSHNMIAVQKLCKNCIWLDRGRIQTRGGTSEVIQSYLAKTFESDFKGEMNLSDWPDRYGRGGVRILKARLLDGDQNLTTRFYRTQPMCFEFEFENSCSHTLQFSSNILSESGERILHLSQYDTPGLLPSPFKNGKYKIRFTIPSVPLTEGNYKFFFGIHTENSTPLDVVRDVLPFEVHDNEDSPRPFKTVNQLGYCWTPNQCSVIPLEVYARE
jgi:lipopolysaccharide transport system ATP-binding protein